MLEIIVKYMRFLLLHDAKQIDSEFSKQKSVLSVL